MNFLLSALKRKPKDAATSSLKTEWSDLLEHSWNPDWHFLCLLTCKSYQDWGQDKGKYYSHGDRLRATPLIFYSQTTPMKNISNAAVLSSSLQHSKPTYMWLSNCLSCSLLGITHSCPMIQAKHKAQLVIRRKPRATVCIGTKNSLKYSSNETALEESRFMFGEGHNWDSGLPWV